jgi:hypothetical protein
MKPKNPAYYLKNLKRSYVKIISLIIVLLLINYITYACPACENQQPKLLKGITHGAGPDGNWDYVIIAIVVIIVLFTLFFSVKWLIRPGEQSQSHIKRLILNNE